MMKFKHDEWKINARTSIISLLRKQPMSARELSVLVDVPPDAVFRAKAAISKREKCVTAERARSKIVSQICYNLLKLGLVVVAENRGTYLKKTHVYALADCGNAMQQSQKPKRQRSAIPIATFDTSRKT